MSTRQTYTREFKIEAARLSYNSDKPGEAFRQRVTKNVAQVEQVLRQENVQVLNLVFDLEAYNFVDTEHLTENGKTYVAGQLAAVIDPPCPAHSTGLKAKDGSPHDGRLRSRPRLGPRLRFRLSL